MLRNWLDCVQQIMEDDDLKSHSIGWSLENDNHDDDDGDDDVGYPAYSHHDKIPPWWGNVNNDEGGNMSVSKIHHTPYTMLNYFLKYIYMSHCQSIVTKLMKFPTLLITTQNLDFFNQMS